MFFCLPPSSALPLCLHICLSAGNDPESYDATGAMFAALKAGNPDSDTVKFPDVVHGWVPRGDISVPNVKEAVDSAMERTYAYFAKFM